MNIAILGDSWAWGEWNYVGEVNMPTHSGTQQYLHEHFPDANIVNFAVAGRGNIYQLDHISEVIGNDQFAKHFDFVICFWTDPGRDVLNNLEKLPSEEINLITKHYYEKLCAKTTKTFLDILDSFNVPVLMMGGQVSVPDSVIHGTDYQNITVIAPRISNLLQNPFFCRETLKPLQGSLDNKIDWLALERIADNVHEELLVEIKDLEMTTPIMNPFYFPDRGHAGREIHKIVANKIIHVLEDFNGS